MTTRRAALGVAALVVVLFAGLLAVGGHLGPATSTETRYAEMGREMMASGDWVVPTLNGAPLLEKPPWEYWVNALSFTLFGVSDLTARLPSLFAGLLTLLVVFAIARRLAPEAEGPTSATHRGLLAVLALATMPGFLVQSYVISTDIWLVLATTLAGFSLLESDRTGGRPRLRYTLLLHAALGVGMLVKGPLTLGLVLGAGVLLAILRRSGKHLRPFVHPLGILVFAAITVPWYVLANQRIPGLLHDLVTRRLFGGLASSKDFHHHSWWVVWLPLFGAFPWLATLPASIAAFARRGAWLRGSGLLLLLLAAGAPVLFTFSASRLPSYASPAFPWLAILCALGAPLGVVVAEAPDRWSPHVKRASIGCALVALGAVVLASAEGDFVAVAPLLIAVIFVLGSIVAAVLCWRAPDVAKAAPRAALAAAFLTMALGAAVTMVPQRLPALRPVWLEIEAHRRPGEEIGVALPYTGDWGLLPWYSRSTVRYFDYPSDPMIVRPEAFAPRDFRPKTDILPWFTSAERRWFLTRERDLRRADYLADAKTYRVTSMGDYVLLTNLPLGDGR